MASNVASCESKQNKQQQQQQQQQQQKKKKKQKCAVKKLTFLVGPKREPLPKLDSDSDELRRLIDLFKDAVKKHFSPADEMDLSGEKKVEKKKKKKKTRNAGRQISEELAIGLSSVLRGVQNSRVVGVIVADPLEIHLQNTIYDVSLENKIPIVFIPNLDDVKEALNISSITCFAFKSQVLSKTSALSVVYEAFQKIAFNFECNQRESGENGEENRFEDQNSVNCDLKHASSSATATATVVDDGETKPSPPRETRFKFVTPPFEHLFTCRRNADIERDAVNLNDENKLLAALQALPVDGRTFPNRWQPNIADDLISITFFGNSSVVKCTAKSAPTSATPGGKRKAIDANETQSISEKKSKIAYDDVNVIQLTPSNKIKQKKMQRKQQKAKAKINKETIGSNKGNKAKNKKKQKKVKKSSSNAT